MGAEATLQVITSQGKSFGTALYIAVESNQYGTAFRKVGSPAHPGSTPTPAGAAGSTPTPAGSASAGTTGCRWW